MKTKKLSSLIKKADELFSNFICASGKCHVCKYVGKVEPHHIVPRTYKLLRWDKWNGMPLCRDCHRWFTDHPGECEEYLMNTDNDRYQYLMSKKSIVYDVRSLAQEAISELE